MKIEDYGFIGDTSTAALVSRDGSIDWFCTPRFDSPACFAALLGDAENGCWRIAAANRASVQRRYRDGTLILETEHRNNEGAARVIDFMPSRNSHPSIIRMVEGISGKIAMRMELIIRFDYGSMVPWVRRKDGALEAIAGPDALVLRTPVETRGENLTTISEFTVSEGETIPFVLTWHPSYKRSCLPHWIRRHRSRQPSNFGGGGRNVATAKWPTSGRMPSHDP